MPNELGTACVKNASPLVNCLVENTKGCKVCKKGFLRKDDTCIEDVEEKGCLKVQESGECENCNFFTGFFAVDHIITKDEEGVILKNYQVCSSEQDFVIQTKFWHLVITVGIIVIIGSTLMLAYNCKLKDQLK